MCPLLLLHHQWRQPGERGAAEADAGRAAGEQGIVARDHAGRNTAARSDLGLKTIHPFYMMLVVNGPLRNKALCIRD